MTDGTSTRGPAYDHLFGPVPSRRLGRSLGVDLVPLKTCTYDCVYCQLGATTDKTCRRGQYVSASPVIRELRAWLDSGQSADYITLSGSGEPTLNSDMGEIVAWIKDHTQIPVAVLTNGALLSRSDVRRDVVGADLVMPSLDAATDGGFWAVNRPCEELVLEEVIQGLVALRREFTGRIWLETMLIAGLNDQVAQIKTLRDVVDCVSPDRLHINTVVRPPAESWVRPVGDPALRGAKRILGPSAEIIAPFRTSALESADDRALPGRIVEMLRRRPCTLGDVADGLGVHRNWVSKHLPPLLESGQAVAEVRDGSTFYRAV